MRQHLLKSFDFKKANERLQPSKSWFSLKAVEASLNACQEKICGLIINTTSGWLSFDWPVLSTVFKKQLETVYRMCTASGKLHQICVRFDLLVNCEIISGLLLLRCCLDRFFFPPSSWADLKCWRLFLLVRRYERCLSVACRSTSSQGSFTSSSDLSR